MVFSTHDTAAARLRALDAMTRGSNSSFEVDSDTEKDKSLIDPPLDDDVEESKRFLVARSSSWPLPLERVTRGMGNLTMSGVNSTVHYVEGKAKDVKSSVDNRWNRFKMKRRIDEYKSTTMKGAREEQCGVMLDLQADESKTTTVESRGTFDEDWSDITASQIGLSKIPVSVCEGSQSGFQSFKCLADDCQSRRVNHLCDTCQSEYREGISRMMVEEDQPDTAIYDNMLMEDGDFSLTKSD